MSPRAAVERGRRLDLSRCDIEGPLPEEVSHESNAGMTSRRNVLDWARNENMTIASSTSASPARARQRTLQGHACARSPRHGALVPRARRRRVPDPALVPAGRARGVHRMVIPVLQERGCSAPSTRGNLARPSRPAASEEPLCRLTIFASSWHSGRRPAPCRRRPDGRGRGACASARAGGHALGIRDHRLEADPARREPPLPPATRRSSETSATRGRRGGQLE